MIIGAWPIGGNKRAGITSASNQNGKCRFILLCSGYILFLIVGAAIISVIEAPQLDREETALRDTKEKFLNENPCIKSE